MCCNNHQNPVGPCCGKYSSISDNEFCQKLHQNEHSIAMNCHVLSLGQETSTPVPVLIQLYLTHNFTS